MKVLWYVNILMPDAAKILNRKPENTGGWLTGAALGLKNTDVQLSIMTVTKAVESVKVASTDSITYIFVPQKNYKNAFQEVLQNHKPTLLHVFGTEYEYNTYLIHLCKEQGIRHVVSIQGIMGECAKHYDDGLPKKYRRINPLLWLMRKIFYADSIALEKRRFTKQGQLESDALKVADAVIGRTAWDRRIVMAINPGVRYYHVNENLRDVFYMEERWSAENCIPHTIFISQSFYPIKGFHMLLDAMPKLISKYPDIKVVVGGQPPYTLNNAILDIAVDYFFEYQKYIKKLIRRNKLKPYIRYTGLLSAEKMKREYLACNLFLSCSTIENSPNSVAEAMILGVPTVASKVGGTESLLLDQEEGLLFEFGNTEALIKSIESVFDSSQFAGKISANARRHALTTHDCNRNTAELLAAYKDIINS